MEEKKLLVKTGFKFGTDNINFCHLGDLGHELDNETISKIGSVDILFVSIDGTFTVDEKRHEML